jgi:replication factor C small subunit
MIKKLKTIAADEKLNISEEVFKTITDICEGDARRSINTLQNIKYIPKPKGEIITIDDICKITSYMEKTYLDKYWKDILNADVARLSTIVIELVNTGYPMVYILQCIKDKVFDSDDSDSKNGFSDKDAALIALHIGKVERMITSGSDNYIQLLAVFAYVNGLHKKLNVMRPAIF